MENTHCRRMLDEFVYIMWKKETYDKVYDYLPRILSPWTSFDPRYRFTSELPDIQLDFSRQNIKTRTAACSFAMLKYSQLHTEWRSLLFVRTDAKLGASRIEWVCVSYCFLLALTGQITTIIESSMVYVNTL